MFNTSILQGLSHIQDEDVKKLINYNAFYRGFVTSTDDPWHLGRVKVRIPAIHGTSQNVGLYTEDSVLPWASPGLFPLAGPDIGQLILPLVGSVVWVTFENQNPQMPIYFGSLYSSKPQGEKYIQGPRFLFQGTQIPITEDDLGGYKSSEYQIIKTLKGATITIDDSDMRECVKILDALGNGIEIKNDGASIYYKREPDNTKGELSIFSGKVKHILRNEGHIFQGKLPYHVSYYASIDNVSEDDFEIDREKVFNDKMFTEEVKDIINGAKLLYLDSTQKIKGAGFIQVDGSKVLVSTFSFN